MKASGHVMHLTASTPYCARLGPAELGPTELGPMKLEQTELGKIRGAHFQRRRCLCAQMNRRLLIASSPQVMQTRPERVV
eukprot:360341-Chlamydomonas_euryale.AAC.6